MLVPEMANDIDESSASDILWNAIIFFESLIPEDKKSLLPPRPDRHAVQYKKPIQPVETKKRNKIRSRKRKHAAKDTNVESHKFDAEIRTSKSRKRKLSASGNDMQASVADKKFCNIQPIFNTDGKLVHSKFDFVSAKPKNSMTGKHFKRLVQVADKRERLVNAKPEKADEIMWKDSMDKADGLKVKDDVVLLKRALRRKEKKKKRSEKKWAQREKQVKGRQDRKQDKRKNNIERRKEARLKSKIKRRQKK